MRKQLFSTFIIIFSLSGLIFSGSVQARMKCWTNNEGVRECGAYGPPEFSQKRTETRDKSGRVVEVKERAKNEAELAEIKRQEELKKIEDAKRAEQKKKDDILLKTFSNERDINMLRDSKINVIEGILIVTNSNNKALRKKLEKLHKKAANIERRGKKPSENILSDIKAIEARLNKNMASIKEKRKEQKIICNTFAKDLQHFRELKNKRSNGVKHTNGTKPTKASAICDAPKAGEGSDSISTTATKSAKEVKK